MEENGKETPVTGTVENRVDLSEEQRAVLEKVLSGENVFFTGGAGTGKSVLLTEIVAALKARGKRCAVTATTGVAAINVGGETFHRFMGIGLGDQPQRELVNKMRAPWTKQKMRDTDVLLIDEISMMHPDLFDKINFALKELRNIWRPFGGIQLVLVGDFFQLPPVTSEGAPVKYCFQAESWEECVPHKYELTRIYRQQSDPGFASVLQEIRVGRCDRDAQCALEACIRRTPEFLQDEIPVLYTTNQKVDAMNQDKLRDLPGKDRVYTARGFGPEALVAHFEKHCLAPKTLRLKVNALVMLVANLDVGGGLANGSTGIVIGFQEDGEPRLPVVRFWNGRELTVDLHTWEKKKTATVPSTYRTEDGETKEFFESTVVASYTQVPLKLAWAITVHKSQGCSLDRARVVLDNVFACGQVYVALSRLKTRDGLYLDMFRPGAVRADPAVLAFHGERVEANGERSEEEKRPSTIVDYFGPKKKPRIGEP